MVISGQFIEFAAGILFQQEAKCGRKEALNSIDIRFLEPSSNDSIFGT